MGESLSEDEFRKALYESLSKKGIVSSFKSHLRQQIALQLSLKGTEKEGTQAALVGDMITAAHLKHSHYDYSLSTFLSEANISDKGLSYTEWLRLLNVSNDSSLARALTASDKATTSPLLSFLEAVVKSCGQGVESAAIQTEAVTLQDKLNMLDEKYADLPADHFLSEQDKQLQKINIENKQIQDIVKLEVERFKELELERYKLLERDRVNKDFNKKLSDYETEYRQRLDGLNKREVEGTRALDKLGTEKEGTQAALVGDMITAAHLKHSHYDYSLSTFLSEANISDKGLSYTEWLRLLNVSNDSSLARALTASDKATTSPLLSFLEAVVKSCGQGVESAAIQTEAVTLQDKLNMLDEKYADLPADHFLSEQDKQLQKINIENKQIQDIVKLEVERFKELELERYKLLERDRVNKDFNKKLSDYETEYRQRLDGLNKREVEGTRALDKLKADTEAGLFKERQLLLSELETLRSRSSQLEREHALTKNQVCLDQEKLGILQARLEERGTNLKEKEEDFRNKLQEHKEKARLQCKAELRAREEKIAAKESQLQEEQEDHMRTRTGLDTHVEEVKKLRTDNANLQDNIVLLEAQLDAARSQALHYEAKLTVTADYEQIKNSLISMEAERKQLLESFDKERRLSKQSEAQLQEIIHSLREQLSRPSQTESDAVNELTKLKHRHYNEVNELKNQVNKIQSELEREQKSRLSAQTELRDQFLECRAHHAVSSQPKPTSTEMPDFLKKYLSSVRLEYDVDADEDISQQSTKLLSDVSVSSDSILRPTRSIVAGSRKLFDQLEQEEQALEREFVSFRNSNMTDMARMAISGTVLEHEPIENFNIQRNVPPESRSYVPAARKPEKPKLTESPGPARVSEPAPTHHVLSEEENPSQSTITPSAGDGTVTPGVGTVTPGDGQKTDIMENLDPVMQQYLNRVLQNKEVDKNGKSGQPPVPRQDDSEHIEQVEFDKTDSDFSW